MNMNVNQETQMVKLNNKYILEKIKQRHFPYIQNMEGVSDLIYVTS